MSNYNYSKMSTKELQKLKVKADAALELKSADPQVVRLRHTEDHYRGDLSCIKFLDKITLERHPNSSGTGTPDMSIVKKSGVSVGTLYQWFGSNGKGRLAAERFVPFDGVAVEWL